jgi:GR25 family glycosyltransferase involved in LPS biosynthesis
VGCDCHRQWEAITLGRVPVMKRSRYLEKVFEGQVVLFVDDYKDVTQDLLHRHAHLVEQAQQAKVPNVEEFYKECMRKTFPLAAPPVTIPVIEKKGEGTSVERACETGWKRIAEQMPDFKKGFFESRFEVDPDRFDNCPLNDFAIDHIYLLNLERRHDRLAHAMAQVEKIGLQGVQRWKAVDGRALNTNTIYSHIQPGMVGCYRSHQQILQDALTHGYNRILVLEDDLVFAPGFNEFLKLSLPKIPQDWDWVYLGSQEHGGFGTHRQQVNEFWVVPRSVWGTQAYMVNGQGTMRKVLKGLEQMHYQVDIQLSGHVLPKSGLKYYSLFPSMVKQEHDVLGTDVQKYAELK